MNLLFLNDLFSSIRNLDRVTVRIPLSFALFFVAVLLLTQIFRKGNDSKPLKIGCLVGAVICCTLSFLFIFL